jgi:hypothetical protein
LLGFEVKLNPCSQQLVRYAVQCSPDELREAKTQANIFWIHPVARKYDDPIRAQVRTRWRDYSDAEPPTDTMLRAIPILERMRQVEGWLSDGEADALITLAGDAIRARRGARIVEVGSYHGRGTVVLASVAKVLDQTARVFAVDPHDGRIGSRDAIVRVEPSAAAFEETLARFGVSDFVVRIQASSSDVEWDAPVDLLVVDGLHDYQSVAADFQRFGPCVRTGARIAFHDCAGYFPDVRRFVNDLWRGGEYDFIGIFDTLAVLERREPQAK